MKKRIVINVTASASWRRRPVGIIRVERELIKQIYRLHPDIVTPVYLDMRTESWKGVQLTSFREILEDNWVLSDNPERDATAVHNHLIDFRPSANDRFVTVGSDWSFDVPKRVAQLYGATKVLVPACYDLIPLLFPEFTPGPEFFEQFSRHYTDVAKYAKSVFAISENSKIDLIDFWDRNGLLDSAPPVKVIPLAGLNNAGKLPELSGADQILFNNIQREGGYVIYVSTLEPRKNHQLLLDVWRELFAERGSNCPQLLIVGMRGWGTDDLVQQMSRMEATRSQRILWLQGVGDDLLAHLYSNALFAVFPSFYEGWGLAATEAAAFGKVCVVSNNSALTEATHRLTPSYHPLDYPGWSNEIKKLIDDKVYREGLEKAVSDLTPQRTWAEFAKDFCDKLL